MSRGITRSQAGKPEPPAELGGGTTWPGVLVVVTGGEVVLVGAPPFAGLVSFLGGAGLPLFLATVVEVGTDVVVELGVLVVVAGVVVVVTTVVVVGGVVVVVGGVVVVVGGLVVAVGAVTVKAGPPASLPAFVSAHAPLEPGAADDGTTVESDEVPGEKPTGTGEPEPMKSTAETLANPLAQPDGSDRMTLVPGGPELGEMLP
jgi:hypothetical protein